MKSTKDLLNCIFWQENLWLVALCPSLEITSQGGSEAETRLNLVEAICLHFDAPQASNCQFELTDCQSTISLTFRHEAPFKINLDRQKCTFKQARFTLEAAGFNGIVQRGNHVKFIKKEDQRVRTAIIPHYTELADGTVAGIAAQAGLSLPEFANIHLSKDESAG